MARWAVTGFAIALGVIGTAACSKSDIGQPCPALLGDADPTMGDADGNRVTTQEVVGQDPTFPCESMVCVATAGRNGYCTRPCRYDESCPDGFDCREVQQVGDFAGQKFCVWAVCTAPSDCGDEASDFCCLPGADPTGATKYCAFPQDGKCE